MSLLSSKQAAVKVYGCKTPEEIKSRARRLRTLAATGRIPAKREGNLWYFSEEKLLEMNEPARKQIREGWI